jgi:hypothetical protein
VLILEKHSLDELGNEEFGNEEFGNEELGPEELRLLQQIHDNLAAIANEIGALVHDLDRQPECQAENRRKRSDGERRAILIERLFQRYNPCSVEIYDHLPYLEQRLRRIHRAGKPTRPRSKSGAASRIVTRSRRS